MTDGYFLPYTYIGVICSISPVVYPTASFIITGNCWWSLYENNDWSLTAMVIWWYGDMVCDSILMTKQKYTIETNWASEEDKRILKYYLRKGCLVIT